MLKSRTITLAGRDDGLKLRLTELPAMLADARARAVLKRLGEDPDGGVAALAFKHSREALKLGVDTLLPFVQGAIGAHELDLRRDIKDWRNVERLQNAALLLHVDFMLGRETLEIPVTFQAQSILAGSGSARATFCSPQIAAVLESGKGTYRELETVLSTEDVFNLVEIINVAALREWHAHQATQ
ncbi:MAG: hypothetical protein P4L92_18745 [Rudaea sp.]|nr:hypothetical protein [Rudaea sp.]